MKKHAKAISVHPLMRFLAYGVDKPQFTKEESTKAIWDASYAPNWTPDNLWDWVARDTIYSIHDPHNPRVALKPTAIFAYLDYIELEEARASSRQAKWIAISPIIISGLIGLGSLVAAIF
jgi:hypothetical protein